MWVLTCLSSKEGLSNIFPQWGQGIVFLLDLAALFSSFELEFVLVGVGSSSSLLELLSPEEREWEGEGRKGREGARGGVAEGGRVRRGKGEEGGETGAELERSRGESWGSGGLSRQVWRRAARSRRAWYEASHGEAGNSFGDEAIAGGGDK